MTEAEEGDLTSTSPGPQFDSSGTFRERSSKGGGDDNATSSCPPTDYAPGRVPDSDFYPTHTDLEPEVEALPKGQLSGCEALVGEEGGGARSRNQSAL